ncbi:hypothetical protein GCM10027275_51650 [Rhabdobacter roseus]|uniref:Uncharacterized protein n=1 Tax=Rhabdobacter roseus TaxID=1655419 RepID=A0A840U580_9BACT|nr:hypothetical protein [Rhabdobacter roseus]MBB5287240.1 hypothetical protein [Rhabdobacter roseus]
MNYLPTPGYQRIKQTSLNFVNAMKMGDKPGIYQKEAGEGESFYGSYHAAHVLDLFGELSTYPQTYREEWAEQFRQRQTEQGYFSKHVSDQKRIRTIEELEPVWHYTRGNIWALRVLGCKPERELAFVEPLLDARKLYQWVKHYDWSNAWAAGNQVLAAATVLFALRDWYGVSEVDKVLEEGMYPALEELMDEKTGFWGTQYGADLPNGLFGTIHITPIYFAQGWELRGLERNVDSTLACQLPDGSFWPGGSDCPDFDGAYMMANLAALTDYRRDDLVAASRRYLEHALMHEDPTGNGWLLHRRDSVPADWVPRPHWIWQEGATTAIAELRDEDPNRTHIMLGSWFYPLSIALISHFLGDTGYEGPYHFNSHSLHVCNVFNEAV